ncbi:MAG: hemolysin family protein [Bacteroidota bacterium]
MGLFLVILLMLALSAFFSGSEIAFVTANRLKTEVRARQAGWVGRVVQEFLADPGTFLTTTLVGNNVALVVYSTLMSLALESPLASFYENAFGLADTGPWVLATQTVIAALVVLVCGEVIPKSLLRQPPGRALFALAAPLKLTYWLFWPVIKLAGAISGGLARLAGSKGETMQQVIHRDFELVIRESRETGSLDLDDEESEILSNVFELRSLRIKDSMVPRTEVRAVDEGASLAEVRQTFIETGFSRLPVYCDNIDTIVGVVLAHDLFHTPDSLAAIVRPARVVPESKPSRDLLFDFLQGGSTLAIAVDEYGGTAGIVTLEDLLEELFGDIRDEHDAAAAPIRRIDDRIVHVHGRVELDALEAETGLALDDGDYDTIAGFVLSHVGSVPDERETFDHDGLRFTVLRATPSRIEAVRIERL